MKSEKLKNEYGSNPKGSALSIRLEPELKDLLIEVAKQEKRSITSLVTYLLEQSLEVMRSGGAMKINTIMIENKNGNK